LTASSAKRKKVIFLFPDPPGFSGQKRAAELTLELFEDSDQFDLIPVKLPGLPKTGGGIVAYSRFALTTLGAMLRIVYLSLFARLDGAFLAISQTRKTLIREHFLIHLVRLLSGRPKLPFGFRLDGSNFTRWQGSEPVAQKFRAVLGEGKFVSVLGPHQKKVIDENFRTRQLQSYIVPNTCEFESISERDIRAKHADDAVISVLHLSSLMEPKGFVEFVESIPDTVENTRVVVCGKITTSEYDRRFSSVSEASNWLRDQSDASPRLTWIPGAFGNEKYQLFREAHIFVMPTDYPVEAQPLVLLEAMACGCAILSTITGEIGYMLDDSTAIILPDRNPAGIANAINRLVHDPELRLMLALNANKKYTNRFSREQNRHSWMELFSITFGQGDRP